MWFLCLVPSRYLYNMKIIEEENDFFFFKLLFNYDFNLFKNKFTEYFKIKFTKINWLFNCSVVMEYGWVLSVPYFPPLHL